MDLSEVNLMIKSLKVKEKNTQEFLEKDAKQNPFEQFLIWFQKALQVEKKPTIMTLATVDEHCEPYTRAVALQELQTNCLIFYSTFHGRKAKQIAKKNIVAVNFYWPILGQQIRIRGKINKIEQEKSEIYFATRKREIQLTLHSWIQSTAVLDRQDLENRMNNTIQKFQNKPVPCPTDWGGYALTPFEYEFYQRRDWFMNDIFLYTLKNDLWERKRLAP